MHSTAVIYFYQSHNIIIIVYDHHADIYSLLNSQK